MIILNTVDQLGAGGPLELTKRVVHLGVAAAMSFALAACGGGGGGGSPASSLTLSTNTLTFVAAGFTQTPPGQVVRATVTGFSGGTLFVRIVSTGPAVGSISQVFITSPTTGDATVFPASGS